MLEDVTLVRQNYGLCCVVAELLFERSAQLIFIVALNIQGCVYVKFADTTSAMKAQQKINGRAFDGKTISVIFLQPTE